MWKNSEDLYKEKKKKDSRNIDLNLSEKTRLETIFNKYFNKFSSTINNIRLLYQIIKWIPIDTKQMRSLLEC